MTVFSRWLFQITSRYPHVSSASRSTDLSEMISREEKLSYLCSDKRSALAVLQETFTLDPPAEAVVVGVLLGTTFGILDFLAVFFFGWFLCIEGLTFLFLPLAFFLRYIRSSTSSKSNSSTSSNLVFSESSSALESHEDTLICFSRAFLVDSQRSSVFPTYSGVASGV